MGSSTSPGAPTGARRSGAHPVTPPKQVPPTTPRRGRAPHDNGDAKTDALAAFMAGLAAAAAPAGGSPLTSAAPPPSLPHARLLLARGRPDDADAVAASVPADTPTAASAIDALRGRAALARGDAATALARFASAFAADPDNADAAQGLGECRALAGDLDGAVSLLERATEKQARDGAAPPLAPHPAAASLAQVHVALADRDPGAAPAHYAAAIAAHPRSVAAHHGLGVAAARAGAAAAALTHFAAAVAAADGGVAPASLAAAAAIHTAAGQHADAAALLARAAAAAPADAAIAVALADARTDAGAADLAAGAVDAAVAHFKRALAAWPRHARALYNAGAAAAAAGDTPTAVSFYAACVAVDPTHADAWNNMGVLARASGDDARAAACYEAALAARPRCGRAASNLAVLRTLAGRAEDARLLLLAALDVDPGSVDAWNNAGVLARDVGDAAASVAAYGAAVDAAAAAAGGDATAAALTTAASNRLMGLNYLHGGCDAAICAAHRAWGEAAAAAAGAPRAFARPPTTPTALRVAYISPDLVTHSVSYFAEAVLVHRTARVRVTVFDNAPRRDARNADLRRRAAAAGVTWVDADALDGAALRAAIDQHKIDILVDLSGHTAGNALASVFAPRAAPVQATWIGYPNTTGLPTMDWRLVDGVTDPVHATQWHSERVARLDGCFLCYTPPTAAPPVAPLPALSKHGGIVTFGSFNALAKHSPACVRAWASILAAVPGSRLLLKARPFACPVATRRILASLAAAGMDPARVDARPLAPDTASHLQSYSDVDIALDPWPYAGTTTTAEALHCGVPVVTLAGAGHAARVGASLLAAAGLQEWVAASEDEYTNIAVRAANDLPALARTRAGLRAQVAASPLCDAQQFVSRLEAQYWRMWEAWMDAGRADTVTETPG